MYAFAKSIHWELALKLTFASHQIPIQRIYLDAKQSLKSPLIKFVCTLRDSNKLIYA